MNRRKHRLEIEAAGETIDAQPEQWDGPPVAQPTPARVAVLPDAGQGTGNGFYFGVYLWINGAISRITLPRLAVAS